MIKPSGRRSRVGGATGLAVTLVGLVLLIGWNEPAWAASVYRCGTELRSYSDRPCGPDATLVPAAGQPTRQQVTDARASAHSEQALANRLRSDRLAREQSAVKTVAAGIRHSPLGLNSDLPEAATTPQKPKGLHGKRLGQKDPRITFEVKVPAPKRHAPARKSAVKPA